MKRYVSSPIHAFVMVLSFFAFCSGQNKAQQGEGLNKSINGSIVQPKLIKTQGSNKYRNLGCGLQDKTGNLWFGTSGEGVYRYDGKLFTNFLEKDGLSSNFVYSILKDKAGRLWFGTGYGVCCYDGKTFTNIVISVSDNKGFVPDNVPGGNKPAIDAYAVPSEENAVWSIIQDRRGDIWFGTTKGVYRYDGRVFTHFTNNDGVVNSTGLQINKVEHILEDSSGNIWFGGRLTKGVFCFDGRSLTNFKPFGDGWLWPMLEDKTGNIWFCSWAGAFRYDGKSFVNFTKTGDLSGFAIPCIAQDKKGNIWFGSEANDMMKRETTGGLWRFDGKALMDFTTKDGLPHNSVWTVLEDKTGNLWIGTRNIGLCRYDGKGFTLFSE